MDIENELPTMRQSKLNLMQMCGHAYYLRYVVGIKTNQNYLPLCGTATHYGRETNLKQKIDSGTDLSLDQVTDATRDCVIQMFDKNDVQPDIDNYSLGNSSLMTMAIDRSTRLAKCDYKENQIKTDPLHIELNIKVDLPKHGFALGGILDLVDRKKSLRDFKTKKTTPSQSFVDDSEQLTLYDLLFRAYFGHAPTGLFFDCVVDLKTKTKSLTLETKRNAHDHQSLLNRMVTAKKAIDAEIFVPASSDHWKCSNNYCEFYNDCVYVNAKNPTK